MNSSNSNLAASFTGLASSIKAKHGEINKLHWKPNIPDDKLRNAQVNYCIPLSEEIVCLIDTTLLFNNADTGIALCSSGMAYFNNWIFAKQSGPNKIDLSTVHPSRILLTPDGSEVQIGHTCVCFQGNQDIYREVIIGFAQMVFRSSAVPPPPLPASQPPEVVRSAVQIQPSPAPTPASPPVPAARSQASVSATRSNPYLGSDLQSMIDATPDGGALVLENLDEFQGPFVIRKPIAINGRGHYLWAKQGPVMTIASPGVTLQNLHMEVSGDFSSLTKEQKVAILMEPGCEAKFHSVFVRGLVEGLSSQAGEWSYPTHIDAGPYRPNAYNSFKFSIKTPVQAYLESEIKGIELIPNQTYPQQSTEILVKIDPLKEGVLIRGEIGIRCGHLTRLIRLKADIVSGAPSKQVVFGGVSSVPVVNTVPNPPPSPAPSEAVKSKTQQPFSQPPIASAVARSAFESSFKITGAMRIATLRKSFKKAFGSTLRVFRGKRFADDQSTVGSVASNPIPRGSKIHISPNLEVGLFEKEMFKHFGLRVQVASSDDSELVDNELTLQESCPFHVAGSPPAAAQKTVLSGPILTLAETMKVKEFRQSFEDLFGATLRFFEPNRPLPMSQIEVGEEAMMGSIAEKPLSKVSFSLSQKVLVGQFERDLWKHFGLRVQVAVSDDSELADDNLALGDFSYLKSGQAPASNPVVSSPVNPTVTAPVPSPFPSSTPPLPQTVPSCSVSSQSSAGPILRLAGKMKIGGFRKAFRDAFGNTLRVYKGQHFADDEATIGSVAGKPIKHGTKFELSPQVKVGDFEKDLWKQFGLRVQVRSPDDSELVDNDLSFGQISSYASSQVSLKQSPPLAVKAEQTTPIPSQPSQPKPTPLKPQPSIPSGHFLLKVSGKMKIGGFRKAFRDAFGSTLRVYRGKHYADDGATIGSVAGIPIKHGTKVTLSPNLKVARLEEDLWKHFELRVQVRTPDDSELVDNDLTLSESGMVK